MWWVLHDFYELGLVRIAINFPVNQYNCFFLTSAFGVHRVLAFTTAKSKFRFSQILLNDNPDMSPPVYWVLYECNSKETYFSMLRVHLIKIAIFLSLAQDVKIDWLNGRFNP